MPTAGGLYYASTVLAPEGYSALAAWFVGWSNFCGFVTAPCSVNYALAAMLVTCGEISNPNYVAQTWHIYLTLLLLLVIQGVVTMQSTWFIGWVNKIGTIFNIIVVIIFVIWFPAGSINHPKTNHSHQVWTSFENGTEWPIGWATIMGFLTTIWTMSGYDAPFHLSEECSNANIASPRAIVMTAQSGLYLGFAVILVIVYTVQDITDVVAGQYGQPFGSLCLQVLGKKAGLAMFSLNIIAQFFVGQGCTITATRVVFAFARDGALPGSKWWSHVDRRTKTPVFATWGVLTVAALLSLLMFASPVAIGAVFSIGAIAQYTSFTTPVALKLFFDRGRFKPGKHAATILLHTFRLTFSRPVESGTIFKASGRCCRVLVAYHYPRSLLSGREGCRFDPTDDELDLSDLWWRYAPCHVILRHLWAEVVQGSQDQRRFHQCQS